MRRRLRAILTRLTRPLLAAGRWLRAQPWVKSPVVWETVIVTLALVGLGIGFGLWVHVGAGLVVPSAIVLAVVVLVRVLRLFARNE